MSVKRLAVCLLLAGLPVAAAPVEIQISKTATTSPLSIVGPGGMFAVTALSISGPGGTISLAPLDVTGPGGTFSVAPLSVTGP
jgi:hypothetical protein